MAKFSIRVSDETLERLDSIAKAKGMDRSSLINNIIEEHFNPTPDDESTGSSSAITETFEQFLEVLPEVLAEAFEENTPIKVEVDTTPLIHVATDLREVSQTLKKLVQTMNKQASAAPPASTAAMSPAVPKIPPSGIR